MKKININTLNIIIILAIIVSTASIVYYFVIFRPSLDKVLLQQSPITSSGRHLTPEEARQKLLEKENSLTRPEALKECTKSLYPQKVYSISEGKVVDKPGVDLSKFSKEDIDWFIEFCMKTKGFE